MTPDTSNPVDPAVEVSLAELDQLLATDDPEFLNKINELKAVAPAIDVDIESLVTDEGMGDDAKVEKPPSLKSRIWARVKIGLLILWVRCKAIMVSLARGAFEFLKVRPKQFALFLWKVLKVSFHYIAIPIQAFMQATGLQKLVSLVLLGLIVGTVMVMVANFKGIWLPSINEPIVRSLEQFADSVETFDPKAEGESFYAAFPQERYEFLFPKFKVNLKRTEDNPVPMGAFEIYVQLDSQDTAIEVRDRQVELHDEIQRAFEEESVVDLATEMGKNRFKSKVKRELNQKLTQGWVKDVSFKTVVLKP